MTLVIAPPLQPWPDYLRKLATEAFVGVPEDADDVRKYILSDGKPGSLPEAPAVAIAAAAMSQAQCLEDEADSARKRILSAAAAEAMNDLDRAADLRVARLRIEALEAELDLARQTIALLSQRPSHQAYDALQQERDALRTQVPVVVAPAKPGIPSRALRFSV